MSKRISVFFYLFIVFNTLAIAQQFNTLQGYVFESGSNKPVSNAVITGINAIARTNDSGFFRINLPSGNQHLEITHFTHDTLVINLRIFTDLQENFHLNMKHSLLREVKISNATKTDLIQTLTANASVLSKKDLDNVPAFLGQQDPIKAILTLPGTGKGGEGNSGIYVRGGTSGQNLTLFNDATIYNASHLLGFFSVFNSPAVDNVKLYKSGIPSEYGGRLSSIIEVNSSKKIADFLKFQGDLSFLAANASLTVPVKKNWSITIAGRKTFMNTSVWPVLEKLNLGSSIFSKMKYDFYDLNLNSNARLSKNNYLFISAYTGGDDFGFGLERFSITNKMYWRNYAASVNWKKIIRPDIDINTIATYSQYNFNFGMEQDKYQASISSQIIDYSFKSYADFRLSHNNIKTGFQYTNHNYKPNTPFAKSAETELNFGIPNTYYADESSAFISDEITFSEKFGAYAGVRFTNYRHKGPYTLLLDDESEVKYTKNDIVSSYFYLEPSITLRYLLNDNSSVKLSYSKNVQPAHLISVTAVNFPADFWMPSLKNIRPEKGYQISAGYFKNFNQNKYESYVDVYYKEMKGLAEFSGGIMSLLDNLRIEENLHIGSGEAYGTEFYVKKKTGKITGWIGYTISKSNRNFSFISESSFAAKYDRRHDLSAVAVCKLNKKWNISGSFTYASGNAYTRPVSRYLIAGNVVNEYGSYNGSRMPSYHRADLAATYLLKNNKKTESSLAFSVYNVYNRQNPIYLFFLAEGDLSKYRVSVQSKPVTLLPVLPTVTYKFSFK